MIDDLFLGMENLQNYPGMKIGTKLKIGIVGTGYAAQKRAEAILQDERASLISITGNSPERIEAFSRDFSVASVDSWQKLVSQEELDLVIICTLNRDHGAIARAALEADKHVVVEYPLALNATEAESIINLAKQKQKLIHIEHMELIGGLHQTIKENLAAIGKVFYARYTTIAPQREVPRNWKYHQEMFGFPLNAALSRISRLTNLFGEVEKVWCQNRYWNVQDTDFFTACLSNAQLTFTNGIIAEITYGKGDAFWWGHRTFEIHGDSGTLLFEGAKGSLIRDKKRVPLLVESRRGLFAKDTTMFLDHLFSGQDLYIDAAASLYATKVADATALSAKTRQIVYLNSSTK